MFAIVYQTAGRALEQALLERCLLGLSFFSIFAGKQPVLRTLSGFLIVVIAKYDTSFSTFP
jgi:hypothetical protein